MYLRLKAAAVREQLSDVKPAEGIVKYDDAFYRFMGADDNRDGSYLVRLTPIKAHDGPVSFTTISPDDVAE